MHTEKLNAIAVRIRIKGMAGFSTETALMGLTGRRCKVTWEQDMCSSKKG